MSKPKYAAVLATVSDRLPIHDPGNRTMWLFKIDDNYSLDRAQRFFRENEGAFGGPIRVRYELMRFKNIKRMLAWADRKGRNSSGLPPLTGWNGPYTFAS